MVQSMAGEGRLKPEEAASHPQRLLLIRALEPEADGAPDMRLYEAQ
jgi:protein phosphatase